MPALTLRIVQIGDLHYPVSESLHGFVDHKDKAFSPELVRRITPDPLMDSLRALIADIEQNDCCAIIAMGDIINQGDKKNYDAGMHVLLDAILADASRKPKTIVLPGNHDINRDDALATNGLEGKFEHIISAARAFGLEPVGVNAVREMSLADGPAQGMLFAMNSCLGCGESRAMPDKIRKQVETLISNEIKSAGSGMLSTYYETLDTPAFGDNALNDLRARVASFSVEVAPVLVVAAHHNILPQAQPRLAPYGELVNAGQVRNLLLSFRRPVVYLHGHIHTDPVEIIQNPQNGDALLISISAPELKTGFNVVEILFNPGGRPFGCLVRRFRTSDGGKITEIDPLRVPFHRHARQAMNPLNARIMRCVFTATTTMYFPELVEALDKLGVTASEVDIAQAVRELTWSSLIIVANDDVRYRDWRIEKPL